MDIWGGIYDDGLSWLVANLERFNPQSDGQSDWKLSGKAFGELVFLLGNLRKRRMVLAPALQRLNAFAEKCLQAFDWQAAFSYYHNVPLLIGYAADFERNGGAGDSLAAVHARSWFKTSRVACVDYTPFRRADLAYNGYLVNANIDDNALSDALQRTVLFRDDAAVYFSWREMYAFTHAVFYLTDFGLRPALELASNDAVAAMQRTTRLCLAVACREGDLDLVAELLLCTAFLNCGHCAITDAAARLLLENRLACGAFTASITELARVSDWTDEERWKRCYHTTLVATLLAAVQTERRQVA